MAALSPRLMANKNLHQLINAATNALPIEQAFVADLINCIEKYDIENKRKPSRKYHPSSMQCIRNMYFQMVGTDMDSNRSGYQLIGMSETGTARHEKLQFYVSIMSKYNMDCEYIDPEEYIKENNLDYLEVVERDGMEVKLYHKGLNLSFKCDGIIKYKGIYFILEIKTETTHKEQVRQGYDLNHVIQGAAYAASFGIFKVLFLYENRDNCHKKGFVLSVTEDQVQDLIVGRIEECDGYVMRLIPPPKPEGDIRKICQYCNYKKSCRKAG